LTIEQQLMQNLRRAFSPARRHPHSQAGQSQPRHRGLGHVLDLLSETDGISQQQIADTLKIRPQSVSEALMLLEERGFIRRESSEKDKRVTLIYINEEGRLRAAELAQERKAHAERFFSVLDEEEKSSLLQLLGKLNAPREDS